MDIKYGLNSKVAWTLTENFVEPLYIVKQTHLLAIGWLVAGQLLQPRSPHGAPIGYNKGIST